MWRIAAHMLNIRSAPTSRGPPSALPSSHIPHFLPLFRLLPCPWPIKSSHLWCSQCAAAQSISLALQWLPFPSHHTPHPPPPVVLPVRCCSVHSLALQWLPLSTPQNTTPTHPPTHLWCSSALLSSSPLSPLTHKHTCTCPLLPLAPPPAPTHPHLWCSQCTARYSGRQCRARWVQ
jgi:hypothetical protein